MAEANPTATTQETFATFEKGLSDALISIESALGTVDMMYTLHIHNHLNDLCFETLGSSLSGLLWQLSETKKIIQEAL